jgi:leucyl-tRNA synthetase
MFNSWYNKESDKAEDKTTLNFACFEKDGNAPVKAVCDDCKCTKTAKRH